MAKFCKYCGASIESSDRICPNCKRVLVGPNGASNGAQNDNYNGGSNGFYNGGYSGSYNGGYRNTNPYTNPAPTRHKFSDVKSHVPSMENGKGIIYASIIVALINIILPFMHWIEVPLFNSFGSYIGMDDVASYSLFGYVFAGSGAASYNEGAVIFMIIALIALISIVLNAVYAIASFIGKEPATRWGTIAAVISLVMTTLLIIIGLLMHIVFQIINLTFWAYLAFALSIVEIVLMSKVKRMRM